MTLALNAIRNRVEISFQNVSPLQSIFTGGHRIPVSKCESTPAIKNG